MESLYALHNALMRERTPAIRRGLMDAVDPQHPLIVIRGSRGVGKTRFLLDFYEEHYADDADVLYVNVNNIFLASEGLFSFIERFYKLGGKALLLDQAHEYPEWDEEMRAARDHFPSLSFVLAVSSLVRVERSPYLHGIAKVYDLYGLSFREFVELESGEEFAPLTFRDILDSHEDIAREVTGKVRPLAYMGNYLTRGYYPACLGTKFHANYLLEHISRTMDFDVPFLHHVDLKFLWKWKALLYMVATEQNHRANVSKYSHHVGISRAMVLNCLCYLNDARLLTLLFDKEQEDDDEPRPSRVYVHNPNVLLAICPKRADVSATRKSFFLSQVMSTCSVGVSENDNFLVDGVHEVSVRVEGERLYSKDTSIRLMDMLERGKGRTIPLWLTGFLY
ncbi:MAG: AAA family ATPase [Odoribacteraceae bacterium]|jgi:predicted AAA+ superfamily ATPase|nr:AAA family ATPase [Odoribacteraceae bacterium]